MNVYSTNVKSNIAKYKSYNEKVNNYNASVNNYKGMVSFNHGNVNFKIGNVYNYIHKNILLKSNVNNYTGKYNNKIYHAFVNCIC